MQAFLTTEGGVKPDGSLQDPPLEKFEAEIAKYRAVQDDMQVFVYELSRQNTVVPFSCSHALPCRLSNSL